MYLFTILQNFVFVISCVSCNLSGEESHLLTFLIVNLKVSLLAVLSHQTDTLLLNCTSKIRHVCRICQNNIGYFFFKCTTTW